MIIDFGVVGLWLLWCVIDLVLYVMSGVFLWLGFIVGMLVLLLDGIVLVIVVV